MAGSDRKITLAPVGLAILLMAGHHGRRSSFVRRGIRRQQADHAERTDHQDALVESARLGLRRRERHGRQGRELGVRDRAAPTRCTGAAGRRKTCRSAKSSRSRGSARGTDRTTSTPRISSCPAAASCSRDHRVRDRPASPRRNHRAGPRWTPVPPSRRTRMPAFVVSEHCWDARSWLRCCSRRRRRRDRRPSPPARHLPRTADGKPDLGGIWQVRNTAASDLLAHAARLHMPAGKAVVAGNEIPYQPGGGEEERELPAPRRPPIRWRSASCPACRGSCIWISRSRSSRRREQIAITFEWSQRPPARSTRTARRTPTASTSGWATRAAAGKATRWSSTSRTTTTRPGSTWPAIFTARRCK